MSGELTPGVFRLLRKRRFLPFFLVQFTGAFNDNLYRNALLVLLVSGAVAPERVNLWVNLAAGLFILPFFIFSPLAGQLADRFDKAKLMRWTKAVEALIMAGAAIALLAQSWSWLLGLLFAMGAHSTFFGPLKYAIMPQHLATRELVAGNALVGMGTFVAILTGTISGTLLAGSAAPQFWIGCGVVLVALFGWGASLWVPGAPAAAPHFSIDWNPVRQLRALYRLAAGRHQVLPTVLAISVFWALGVSYLTQIPNFVVSVLGGTPALIAVLLCAFVVGIATGSWLCARIGGGRGEIGLVPVGGLGLLLCSLDLGLTVADFEPLWHPVSPWALLTQWPVPRVLVDIVCLGVSGGLYVVPLYVQLQRQAGDRDRARIIAFNNLLNALFMVAASLLGMLVLGVLQRPIPEFFMLLGALQGLAMVLLLVRVPDWLVQTAGWLLGRIWFGVRAVRLPSEHVAMTRLLHCPADPLAVLLALTRVGRPEQLWLPARLQGWRWRLLRSAVPVAETPPEGVADDAVWCRYGPDTRATPSAIAAFQLRLLRHRGRRLILDIAPMDGFGESRLGGEGEPSSAAGC